MGIFKNIFGKNKKTSSADKGEQGKYMPKENMPVDELFYKFHEKRW